MFKGISFLIWIFDMLNCLVLVSVLGRYLKICVVVLFLLIRKG